MALSGCAGGVCTGWSPIYVGKSDKLSDTTAREILTHNEYGHKLSCPAFKPKG